MNGFLGIDPGKTGGMALLNQHGDPIELFKMEGKTETDAMDFIEWCISLVDELTATLEKISSSPLHQMPVGVVIKRMPLVQSWGVLWGILTALRIQRQQVAAADWQKAIGCLTKGDKKVSYRKAQELFPETKVTHWNADALLIAEHCRRVWIHRNALPAQPIQS